jgi:hypothetical protein
MLFPRIMAHSDEDVYTPSNEVLLSPPYDNGQSPLSDDDYIPINHIPDILSWVKQITPSQRRPQRRKSLSTGPTLRSTRLTSRKHEQQQNPSPFQLLPLELRHMIYAYILDDQLCLHLGIARRQRLAIPDSPKEDCTDAEEYPTNSEDHSIHANECSTNSEDCHTNPFPDHSDCAKDSVALRHLRCVSKYSYCGPRGDRSRWKKTARHLHGPITLFNLLRTCRQM